MGTLPVFTGGFRSGTTLLINLLGMHSAIAPWFETKELCEALRWLHVRQHPSEEQFEMAYCVPAEPAGFSAASVAARMHWHMRDTHARSEGSRSSGKAAHERYPLGNDYVLYSLNEAEAALAAWREQTAAQASNQVLAEATGKLIRTLAARQTALHGGGSWINKTPEITRFAAGLRAALGPCRIVYVVRDGMQVVASGHRLNWGSVENLAFNWKELLLRTRAAMQEHAADYLEIRYERLVQDPAATLDQVLTFCNFPALGQQIVSRFTNLYGSSAFDTSRLTGGRDLDADARARFNAVAGAMQQALGYAN